ncbi:MAG: hypothetical protein WCI97_10740 [Bacteroidota bacterium]
MKQILFLSAFLFLFSCNGKKNADPNYNSALENVKTNMNFKEVEDLTGKPASIQDLGTSTTETGDTSHLIQWFFGTNQSVMFTNGKVSGIDLDMKTSMENIQHIMDSAKAVDGTSGGIQIQPQQQ